MRFKFDLHGFTLDEANIKVKSIIEHCIKNKFKELLLITGKGMHSTSDENTYISKELGKLKYSVPEYIKSKSDLMKLIQSINDESINNSTKGSFELYLKKFKE